MNENNIIVIGGGPAGIMAAIAASKNASRVILLEKTGSLGNKLLLTGNGRCNLTNACDLYLFLEKFSKNGAFLRNAFDAFFNTSLIEFFEERGLKCKTEAEERVFPITDKAGDILNVLKSDLHRDDITILYNSPVQKILSKKKQISGVQLKNGDIIDASEVVLATGGLSYPLTGSTGDGLKMVQHLGHTVVPPSPGLVPILIHENIPKHLKGLSLQNVSMKITCGKSKKSSPKGDLLFTEKGLSGPLTLSTSGIVSDFISTGEKVYLTIDQFPDTSKEDFSSILKSYFKIHPSKSIRNSFKNFIPQRMSEMFLDIAKIDPSKRSNQITKKELLHISSLCKELRLSVLDTAGFNEAMITCGGISLKERYPRTMGSRLINGLFFAGEIIDVAGDTGGFNLQAAFSTGHLAGINASS